MLDPSASRRRFLGLSGVGLLATAFPAVRARTQAPPGLRGRDATASAELYRRALVVDANTLASIGYQCADQAAIQAVRDSGITALKSTLGGAAGSFEETVADIAAAQALIEHHPETFLKVRRHDDLARAKREGKVGVILSFEAASMLEGRLDRIDLFRRFDVLAMGLTYNTASPFGNGCLTVGSGGVTPLGRQAIARMNAAGIALDLSHANAPTTADGIALSAKPAVITHAGCHAVYAHPRNKRDREMRALAERGGVMGIYMLPFLTDEHRQPMLEDYLRHMLHALDVCGEDHVGIGTDSLFFTASDDDLEAMAKLEAQRSSAGVAAPGENRPPYIPDLNTPRKLERVCDALGRKGYGARVVEKVLGLNFSRVFNEIWLA